MSQGDESTTTVPSTGAVVADLEVFANEGAGYWRLKAVPLQILPRLPSVTEAQRTGKRSEGMKAQLNAIEDLVLSAAKSLPEPWSSAAHAHLGFDTPTTRASHVRSRTGREDLAARKLGMDGTTYRRTPTTPRDDIYASWRIKTLTLVANAIIDNERLHPASPPTLVSPSLAAGVSGVFGKQAEVEAEIAANAEISPNIDILAIRGLGILGLNEALLRPALAATHTPKTIRILYLDPTSPFAAVRAEEVGESSESFATGINLGLAKLDELRGDSPHQITIRLYNRLPIWRIIRFADVVYASSYVPGKEGQISQMFCLAPHPVGVLFQAFCRVFDELFEVAHPYSSGPTKVQ